MKRLAFLLFLLLSVSFVALHFVLPYIDSKQELVQSSELGKAAEEESENKQKKEANESYYTPYSSTLLPETVAVSLSSYYPALLLPGFSKRLFTPPDFS